MRISIRRFERQDIPNKVRWINDPDNNKYLHYELPLEVDKTERWYDAIKKRTDRYDAVIEADGFPVGLIGLLSIDRKFRKAEYYISMGEASYKGKGVAFKASELLLNYAFESLHLKSVYLFTEEANIPAQRLFEKLGFRRERLIRDDRCPNGKIVDRYFYVITRAEYPKGRYVSPIQYLGELTGNMLYVKREDLIPYSFGGNKARKAELFFKDFDNGGYDCVLTYGSGHSNHCRVVANMAAKRGVPCYIISPKEASAETFNSRFTDLFGASVTIVPVDRVSKTIENKLQELRDEGFSPYFIAGGGHGNLGTQAYVDCYDEISDYEDKNGIKFDYIFLASGTGTTQAGLVCGQLLDRNNEKRIVGISIARRNPRGRQVVVDSINDYLSERCAELLLYGIDDKVVFLDDYVEGGYGDAGGDVLNTVKDAFIAYGIPMDSTYTGKAFDGMKKYIRSNNLENKSILFIHTGGTPLFFDDILMM